MVFCTPECSRNTLHTLGTTNFLQHSADQFCIIDNSLVKVQGLDTSQVSNNVAGTCERYTTKFSRLLDCGCQGLCLVQISAIKVLLNDLKGGLSKVNTEILKAAGVDANSAFAHRQFGDLMVTFHEHAKSTLADAEVTLHLIAAFKQPLSYSLWS